MAGPGGVLGTRQGTVGGGLMGALTAALGVFSGPWGWLARIGVYAALALAVGLYGWFKGNEHGTQKLTDYIAKEATEKVRIAKARDVVTTQVVTKYVKVQGDTRTITQYVEKEVVKYAESNPGYCLDARWRSLHDAAASNRLPGTGPEANDSSGAPKAATAIATVTENYGACNRTADRLDALQDWVRKQQAVR